MVATVSYLGLLQGDPNKARRTSPLLPCDIRKFISFYPVNQVYFPIPRYSTNAMTQNGRQLYDVMVGLSMTHSSTGSWLGSLDNIPSWCVACASLQEEGRIYSAYICIFSRYTRNWCHTTFFLNNYDKASLCEELSKSSELGWRNWGVGLDAGNELG